MNNILKYLILILIFFQSINISFAVTTFIANDISGDTGNSTDAAMGDVDGDDDLDIYISVDGAQNKLWINDGTGEFIANDISGDTGSSNGVVMGDVDGDDDLDIYVSNNGAQNKLWINDGTGEFTANDISGDTGNSQDAVMGDVDGDDDLDIYVVNYSQQNKLWINDGTGEFTANDILGDTGDTYGTTIGDVDGDDDLDIYVANYNQQNKLWINDGTGEFTENGISDDTGLSTDAEMGDVDGDDDLDIYVAVVGQHKLWINDGTGEFTENGISGDTGASLGGVVMGDVDGDDDLDIYVANYTQQNKLWINDGTGEFTANDISGDVGDSYGAAIGDVDSDTDLDIYVANNFGGQNKLWVNQLDPDIVNPSLSSLSPLDNATSVSTSTSLTIVFDESVDVETGNILIKKTVGDTTIATIGVTGGLVTGTGTDTITINPSSDLDYETEYYVQIASTAFDDTAGNSFAGITNTTSWSFTTVDAPAEPVVEGRTVISSGSSGSNSNSGTAPTPLLDSPTPSAPQTNNGTLTIRGLLSLLNITLTPEQEIAVSELEKKEKASSCLVLNNRMQLGSDDTNTNGEVTKLQRFLIQQGLLSPDIPFGYFGNLTTQAVQKFQIQNNIVTEGTPQTTGFGGVGPVTRAQIAGKCI